MHRNLKILLGLAILAAPTMTTAAPADVATAVSSTTRSAENVKLDGFRKPAEVLQFFGLEQGARVLDISGANRYWAEIIAPAIGPNGQIVVWEANQFLDDKARQEFAEFASKQGNVTLLSSPMETPLIGNNAYDFAIFNLGYHDTYWESAKYKISRVEPDAWLRTLYAAMKPGAVVGIIDHAATPGGDTREVVEKLHRIDPAVVRADFERAGFVLDGTSDILRNAADDHSLNVFNPNIRGKTDRFIYRFRKPS